MSQGELESSVHQFTYPESDFQCSVVAYVSPKVAASGLARYILKAQTQAIEEKDSFSIVLSGGSLVKSLSALLELGDVVAWDKWHVFWADERVVPHTSEDSNYKGAMDAFLSKTPIPGSQIYPITERLDVQQAATNYEGKLFEISESILPRNSDNFPVFDVILLGVGPDGHVCSLFPNRPETAEKSKWILPVTDSPKRPPERITMTMPVVNSGKHVAIIALGEGKAEIVQRVMEVQSLPGALPAQLVRPTEGELTWILDVGAISQLSVEEWDNKKSFPRNQ
eukprot:TRINITY_DN5264_c1_g1_i4.p1 TRINITY_DN5264_c1_g1~~TRINITY_DN5264_c1_g1_i4.p1  ORF type:complete len:314 (-),score=45.84 TRINITY_DN5264_c1_g1_i4:322-1164(-)